VREREREKKSRSFFDFCFERMEAQFAFSPLASSSSVNLSLFVSFSRATGVRGDRALFSLTSVS